MKYGKTIKWSVWGGIKQAAGFADTSEKAFELALEKAKQLGWTPPKWWQWWRWGDKNYNKYLKK